MTPSDREAMDIGSVRAWIIRPELGIIELKFERSSRFPVGEDKEEKAAADLGRDPLWMQFVDLPQLRSARVGPRRRFSQNVGDGVDVGRRGNSYPEHELRTEN